MRLSQTPPSLLSLLYLLLSARSVYAGPLPKDDLHGIGFSYLQDRNCLSYCGAQNQYCCLAGEACYTSPANIAYCSAGAGAPGGGYTLYTTTYTETDLVLRTSTISSWYSGAPTSHVPGPVVTAPAICAPSRGESSCGAICCASDQRCAFANSCTAYVSSYVAPTGPSTYSAPVRPTSGGISTATATTTVPFSPPATASGSTIPLVPSTRLSGGQIAGIVIGVVVGVFLLLGLCFFFMLKAGVEGILSLFGLGSKKKAAPRRSSDRNTVSEDRYTRRGAHNSWYGSDSEKRKSGGSGGKGFFAAAFIAIAILLGLKQKEKKSGARHPPPRSDYSSTYYTDTFTGSSIRSISSDGRTRDSRRTRDTRTTIRTIRTGNGKRRE